MLFFRYNRVLTESAVIINAPHPREAGAANLAEETGINGTCH